MKLLAAVSVCLLALVTFSLQAEASDPPDFVFGGAEVTRWYNADRPLEDRITITTGRQAAHYLNGLVVRYLRALEARDLIWHWQGVADCESGGDWSINTGNGYYGGVQFSLATWRSVGGSGYPHQNSASEQAYRADILRQRSGLGQWPVCGSRYR